MLLSNKFLNVVDKALQDRLNQRLFLELSDVFRDQLDPAKEAEGVQSISAQRKEAAKKGITTEKGAYHWLGMYYLLGADFFEDALWQQYISVAARTIEYALESFFNEVCRGMGMTAVERNGFGLSEAAYDVLPATAAMAVNRIKTENRFKQLVGILLGSTQFLITAPSAITQNPYNVRIASLNTEISATEEQIRKTDLAARDMRLREFAILIENSELRAAMKAAGEEGQDPSKAGTDKIKANELELETLKGKLAKETEKTTPQIAKLTEKIKTLSREIELLKATKK